MDIVKIMHAVVTLVPTQIKNYFFGVVEDWIKDETTGIPAKIGLIAVDAARLVTGTEDLPDKGESFEAVLEHVLSEAAQNTDHPKVENIKDALNEIVQSESNPVTLLDIPAALIQ